MLDHFRVGGLFGIIGGFRRVRVFEFRGNLIGGRDGEAARGGHELVLRPRLRKVVEASPKRSQSSFNLELR
jgi:hypothetical protein